MSTQPKIGLTLSGGGFRATLFHLGTIRYLHEVGMLKNVSHICSVSGGSILAAHLVLNWERYTGDQASLDGAMQEVVDFVQQDLRGRVVRPWLFSYLALGIPRVLQRGKWSRTALLMQEYDRLLYHSAKLGELNPVDRPDRPQLHLLSASLCTGQLVSFGMGHARIHSHQDFEESQYISTLIRADEVPVSLAVAASSAFPPLFPPVMIDTGTFNCTPNALPNPHFLADGGIFDNLGIRKLLWLNREGKLKFDLVVVSDAQREFSRDHNNEYRFIWGRASRSVDLLMDRVSWFEGDSITRLCEEAGSRLLECRLHSTVGRECEYAQAAPVQFAVQNARTDLDAFNVAEVNAIARQGYSVARYAWEKEPPFPTTPAGPTQQPSTPAEPAPAPVETWQPIPTRSDERSKLGGISRRKLGLFSPGHWVSWAMLGLVLLYAGLVAGWMIWQQVAQAAALAKATVAEEKARNARANYERKIQHVKNKIRLIEALGELALSAESADWDDAHATWLSVVAEVRKSHDWFDSYLNPDEQIGAIPEVYAAISDRSGTRAHLQLETLKFAKQLRKEIERAGEQEYLAVLSNSKERWVRGLNLIVDRLTSPFLKTLENRPKTLVTDYPSTRKPTPTELEHTLTTRREFWRLYWGELALVESVDLEAAMWNFGETLQTWESQRTGPAKEELRLELESKGKAIKDVLRRELLNPPVREPDPG